MAQHSFHDLQCTAQHSSYTTYYNGTAHDLLQWHSTHYNCNGTALTRLTMAQHSFHDLPWHSITVERTLLITHTASMGVKMPIYAGTASVGVNTPVYLMLTQHQLSEHALVFTLTQHRWGGKHGTAPGFPMMYVRYKYSKILYFNTYKDQ